VGNIISGYVFGQFGSGFLALGPTAKGNFSTQDFIGN